MQLYTSLRDAEFYGGHFCSVEWFIIFCCGLQNAMREGTSLTHNKKGRNISLYRPFPLRSNAFWKAILLIMLTEEHNHIMRII